PLLSVKQERLATYKKLLQFVFVKPFNFPWTLAIADCLVDLAIDEESWKSPMLPLVGVLLAESRGDAPGKLQRTKLAPVGHHKIHAATLLPVVNTRVGGE